MNITLYKDSEPVEISFVDSTHRYKADGVPTVGVSTICGVLAKDLMSWASWMAAEAFKAAVEPFATTDSKITKAELKTMADKAKKAHATKSQKGKDVGTIAHAWIHEECEKGHSVEVPEYSTNLLEKAETEEDIQLITQNIMAAEHCVKEWRQWVIDYDIEFIKTETIVFSKKLRYCGTFDVLFKSKKTGKVYLGDYKTSEPQKIRNKFYQITGYKPYPEHFVQISGYDYAHSEETGFSPDGYTVIYLPKEGKYQTFSRYQVEDDRQGWEKLFGVYKWVDSLKKGSTPNGKKNL